MLLKWTVQATFRAFSSPSNISRRRTGHYHKNIGAICLGYSSSVFFKALEVDSFFSFSLFFNQCLHNNLTRHNSGKIAGENSDTLSASTGVCEKIEVAFDGGRAVKSRGRAEGTTI